MGLRERFTEQMKAAMRAKEARRLSTIRLMLDAVQKQDIASKSGDISDDEVLTVLGRMIKQREESAATYESGGRPELAQAERDEITVIREFMPKQMSAEESREAVKAAIAATGAASMKDMGKVMAALKERHAGQMDFGRASGLVKELLTPPKS
jgi:uncharacterized protein YqeY